MADKHHHEEEEHENEERWLLTYADLITLLMVFFVVMYSMSKVDQNKFKALAQSLSAAFNNPALTTPLPMPGVGGRNGDEATAKKREKDTAPVVVHVDQQKEKMQKLAGQFSNLFKEKGLENSVNVAVSGDGKNVVIRLADSLLFGGGSASLTPESLDLIDKMFEILSKTNSQVQVEGHTDNIPISNDKFKNNWDLSTARAVNVIEHVSQKFALPPERLSASGYAEYHPVAPNDTPEGRAKNRRVEFVIKGEETKEEDTAPPAIPAEPVTAPAVPNPAEPAKQEPAGEAAPAATTAPAATEHTS